MRSPVPHVERVHAVVRVRVAVQVDVPRVGRELLLELALDRRWIRRLREHLFEEVDVARVVDLMELVGDGVEHDHHAAGTNQRLTLVHVEEVAEPLAHDEDRVHDRVDVVRADVRQSRDQHVGLTVDLDQLLTVHVRERLLVHGAGLARVHAGDAVRRVHLPEHLALHVRRRAIGEPLRREVRRLIAHRPLPLALLQEPCRPPERVVVERRLDREDLDVFGEQLAHPHRRVMQCRRRRVHVRLRVHHGVDVVVVTDAAVAGQSDRHALVSAVHRHQVDVHVHDQIALGRAFIDLDLFALLGLADEREVRAILRVVVVERLRVERAVHPLPHRALQLRRRHTPVQRKRGDDLDVVHACARGGLEHVLHDAPADVRRLHLRQRQRDVVERDRQFHPGLQQRRPRPLCRPEIPGQTDQSRIARHAARPRAA